MFVNGIVKRLKIGAVRFAGNTIPCRIVKPKFKVKSCKKVAQYYVLKQKVKFSGAKCQVQYMWKITYTITLN